MKKLLVLSTFLLFISCNDNGLNIILSEIEEDFSNIQNPKERWEAYNLSDYSIDQTWTCECIPPMGSTNFVVRGKIIDIKYNDTSNSRVGADFDDARTQVSTIDRAFDLIEEFQDKADTLIVNYHPRFGYPTSLKIDESFMIADEEISYKFKNLQKIESF